MALGSPLGLSFTATSGVISALRPAAELSREIGQSDLDGNWVQVDAALSPGNSGGPIVDERGAVVAMSTLASQGAQNLNFGISAPDIRQLLLTAKNTTPLSLAAGVGHLGEKTSRGSVGGAVAESAPVPKTALEAYVAKGVSDFDQIKQDLGKEIKRLGDSLRELRRVRTQSFGDKMVKDEVIDVIVDRMKELRTIDTQLTTAEDTTGLFSLLTKFGPKLDTRFKESIGFMSGGVVLQAYDAHTALVIYEDAPYLMYMETTAGLSTGRELLPCPVYVNGTATAVSPEGRTISVTLLQAVPEIELRPVVDQRRLAGESAIADAEFRNWSDNSGRFSVEAILVELTQTEAVLRTREGKFIRVPIDKLSGVDRKVLGK